MGLRTAARIEAQRQDAVASKQPDDAGQATLSDQLLAFIPTETLAPTVALFGFFADDRWEFRAAVVAIALVLTPVWVWVNYVNAATTDEAQKKIPVWSACFGIVAYLLWVGSVPATPFLQWDRWTLHIGTACVLVGGFVLFGLSQVHLAWKRRQAVDDPPGGGGAPEPATP
jgi:hypothetical protein